MFKLMIADDNPYVLQDLAELIDWEDFDFDLIGTFQNGNDLLTSAKNVLPDLVITDISMPQMDGMQLSSNLYQLNPSIKIIFISERSEFEYAKKALKLHIFDYLVKPVQPEQLSDVMKKILYQLQKEQNQHYEQIRIQSQQDFYRKTALSHYASRLLFFAENELQIRNEFAKLGHPITDLQHLYVICYELSQLPNSFDYFQSLFESNHLESKLLSIHLGNQQGVFLAISHTPDFSIQNQLARLCIDVETQMNCCIIMGYSESSNQFTDLPKLYEQAQLSIKHLKDSAIKIPMIAYQDIHTELDTLQMSSENTLRKEPININISRMRTYIEENFMLQITTYDVAHSVFFSPSYANHCFTHECGTTIFGYITQCRMEKAKDLLVHTDEQISRIAELVGYSGKTSFYLAFKRYTGISPTEYRLQHNK